MSESKKPAEQATKVWRKVHRFALGMPEAYEEHPWGESAVKVNKKVFVFFGVTDGSYPLALTLKLADEEPHAHALTMPGAEPAGYGLGKAGWVRVPLEGAGAPGADLLCDWVEESYRAVATRKLVAELDSR